MTLRLAMWSGPRIISTAVMRSFGARPDTFVRLSDLYGALTRAESEEIASG